MAIGLGWDDLLVTDRVHQPGTSRRDLFRYALAAGVGVGISGLPTASVPTWSPGPVAPIPSSVPLLRPRVAKLGDSITQFAEYATITRPTRISRRVRGAMTWVKTLFPAFDDDTWHYPADLRQGRYMRGSNSGIAGDHLTYVSPLTPGTLRRWANEVAPTRPDLVVLSIGTNDINSYDPIERLQGGLQRHIDDITGAGHTLVLTTIRPRAGSDLYGWAIPDQLSDPRYATRRALNDWIRSRTAPNLVIADVNERLEAPSSRAGHGGDWLPAVAPPDGVHPGALAAWAEAQTLLPILRSLIADENLYGADPLAPGNLLPNGHFGGAQGRIGPGVTGKCATGWAITRTAGDAHLTAYKTIENGVEKQVLEITPGIQESTFVLGTDPARLSLAETDGHGWLRFHVNQEVTAYPGWKAYTPRLFLSDAAPAWTTLAAALETFPGESLPDAAWHGWPATHPVRKAPGDVSAWCSMLVTVAGGVPGTPTLRFSQAHLRQIPDPRPAWHLPT